MTQDKRKLEKAVKSVHAGLKRKYKKYGSVLHAYHEKPATRRRLLEKMAQLDIKIMTIYLNKSKVYTNLREEKNILYNYITNILLDRICTKRFLPKNSSIQLIVERKDTNKFLNHNFSRYLSNQAIHKHNVDISIQIKTSDQERALQATDFASWAVFRKYESKDKYYYDLITSKIVEENSLYK